MPCGGCGGGGRNRRLTEHRLPTSSGGEGVITLSMADGTIPIGAIPVQYTGHRVGSFSVFGDSQRAYRFSTARSVQLIAKEDVVTILRMPDFRLASGSSETTIIATVTPRLVVSSTSRQPPKLQAQTIINQIMVNEKKTVESALYNMSPTVAPIILEPRSVGLANEIDAELQRTIEESDPEQVKRARTTRRTSKVEDRGTVKTRVYPGM